MLNPNSRSLFTDAITPPVGMKFGEAIATTFSFDPSLFLSFPLHLSLLAGSESEENMDGIALLESLRRVLGRITVFGDLGRMIVPNPPNILYGLLEPVFVEVRAPSWRRGGVFHPKIWFIKFESAVGEGSESIYRLLILSRNITKDRSWDVALTLDGRMTGRNKAVNRELGELIASLPSLATREMQPDRVAQIARLAEEIRKVEWDLPEGFDEIHFVAMGLKKRTWLPEYSNALAVISPFCSVNALKSLSETSDNPVALVSRPEVFQELSVSDTSFANCFTLDESSETEDGEEVLEEADVDTIGLHAKVYILEVGRKTHLIMGSANATDPALIDSQNVEIIAELIGSRKKVGGIEELLGSDGLGDLLVRIDNDDLKTEDLDAIEAEKRIETVRKCLTTTEMKIKCEEHLADDETIGVHIKGIPNFIDDCSVKCWPVSVKSDRGKLVAGENDVHFLGEFTPEQITGIIAFEISDIPTGSKLRFAINIPIENTPVGREAAILRAIINNRDGFLRYILMLLSDLAGGDSLDGIGKGWIGKLIRGNIEEVALLEEMVRAYSRNPERLTEIQSIIQKLASDGNTNSIIPPDFYEIWEVFKNSIEDQSV